MGRRGCPVSVEVNARATASRGTELDVLPGWGLPWQDRGSQESGTQPWGAQGDLQGGPTMSTDREEQL